MCIHRETQRTSGCSRGRICAIDEVVRVCTALVRADECEHGALHIDRMRQSGERCDAGARRLARRLCRSKGTLPRRRARLGHRARAIAGAIDCERAAATTRTGEPDNQSGGAQTSTTSDPGKGPATPCIGCGPFSALPTKSHAPPRTPTRGRLCGLRGVRHTFATASGEH